MPITLQLRRDRNNSVTYGIDFPPQDDATSEVSRVLDADTEATLVVPRLATDAIFSYGVGTNVYVGMGDTPLILPTSGQWRPSNGELRPAVRKVIPGETLRFLCSTTADVNITFRITNIGNRGINT